MASLYKHCPYMGKDNDSAHHEKSLYPARELRFFSVDAQRTDVAPSMPAKRSQRSEDYEVRSRRKECKMISKIKMPLLPMRINSSLTHLRHPHHTFSRSHPAHATSPIRRLLRSGGRRSSSCTLTDTAIATLLNAPSSPLTEPLTPCLQRPSRRVQCLPRMQVRNQRTSGPSAKKTTVKGGL
jgi:hypothetical protein